MLSLIILQKTTKRTTNNWTHSSVRYTLAPLTLASRFVNCIHCFILYTLVPFIHQPPDLLTLFTVSYFTRWYLLHTGVTVPYCFYCLLWFLVGFDVTVSSHGLKVRQWNLLIINIRINYTLKRLLKRSATLKRAMFNCKSLICSLFTHR